MDFATSDHLGRLVIDIDRRPEVLSAVTGVTRPDLHLIHKSLAPWGGKFTPLGGSVHVQLIGVELESMGHNFYAKSYMRDFYALKSICCPNSIRALTRKIARLSKHQSASCEPLWIIAQSVPKI